MSNEKLIGSKKSTFFLFKKVYGAELHSIFYFQPKIHSHRELNPEAQNCY
jgi:hypothetical protein